MTSEYAEDKLYRIARALERIADQMEKWTYLVRNEDGDLIGERLDVHQTKYCDAPK